MITHGEAIEIIEGLPHTMKVPLRKMIKHAQKEHELLELYRENWKSMRVGRLEKKIEKLEKELEEMK